MDFGWTGPRSSCILNESGGGEGNPKLISWQAEVKSIRSAKRSFVSRHHLASPLLTLFLLSLDPRLSRSAQLSPASPDLDSRQPTPDGPPPLEPSLSARLALRPQRPSRRRQGEPTDYR